MHFYRLLIVLLLGSYLLAPIMEDWWLDGDAAWYRPFIIWAVLILCAAILEWRRRYDEF